MSRGKRYADKGFELGKIPWKTLGIIVLVIGVIVVGVLGGKKAYSALIANGESFNQEIEKESDDVVSKEEEKMPTIISNFKVLGELKIEARNFSQYILDVEENTENLANNISNSSENTITAENNTTVENTINLQNEQNNSQEISKALKSGLVKLYGDKINAKGNFCIIGHNEQEYFSVLNELNIDDKFSIKTSSNTEKDYIVTDIYTVNPTDLKCLMQNEKYVEVTLITCTTGSNQRLVVKGIEENDYKKYIAEKNNETQNVENAQTNVAE